MENTEKTLKVPFNGRTNGYMEIPNIPIVIQQVNAEKLPGKACEQCGTKFVAARKDAKYCSASCRQKAYQSRQDEEQRKAIEEQQQRAHATAFKRFRTWLSDKLLNLSRMIRPK
jgi:hypothetical protein